MSERQHAGPRYRQWPSLETTREELRQAIDLLEANKGTRSQSLRLVLAGLEHADHGSCHPIFAPQTNPGAKDSRDRVFRKANIAAVMHCLWLAHQSDGLDAAASRASELLRAFGVSGTTDLEPKTVQAWRDKFHRPQLDDRYDRYTADREKEKKKKKSDRKTIVFKTYNEGEFDFYRAFDRAGLHQLDTKHSEQAEEAADRIAAYLAIRHGLDDD